MEDKKETILIKVYAILILYVQVNKNSLIMYIRKMISYIIIFSLFIYTAHSQKFCYLILFNFI